MKTFTSILLLLLLSIHSIGQVSKDFTVQAWVETNKSNPSITINWPYTPEVANYNIYRKAKSDANWDPASKVILSGNDTTWTDTAVAVGQMYEYKLLKLKSNLSNGYTYILSGIEVPLVHNRGNILILVEKMLLDSIPAELKSYYNDIAADGWNIYVEVVNKTDSIQKVKRIVKAVDARSGGLKSLLILGHVPVPYSGNFAPDGHSDHAGCWPTDAYYSIDFDNWADAITNTNGIARSENKNLPGDSKWDNNTFPAAIKYFTGRVDLSNMPKFSKNEAALTKQYLKKAHDFRYKITKTVAKGVIDENIDASQGGYASTGWRNFAMIFGSKNIIEEDYLNTCRNQNIMFGYGVGAGTYTSCNGIGTTDSFVVTKGAVFNMLFGSYFGDWNSTNNLLRAPLASSENGLTNAWSGRPYWENHPMAMGEPIGYCAMITQNNKGEYDDNWHTNTVPIGLMGDPTLRVQIIAPPTNISISAISNNSRVKLTWSPSKDSGVLGYYIYQSQNPLRNTSPINSSLITDTTYIDNSPDLDTNYYLVKAVLLTTTPSGSYFNMSQGISAKITGITENTNPVVITKNITKFLDSTGNCSISSSDIDSGSHGMYEIASYSLDKSSFNCSNLGDNTVHLTITDINDSTGTNSAIVKIKDLLPPKTITKNITLYLNASGQATLNPASINNGSSDNCGVNSMSLDKSDFSCNDIGNKTVTLTVSDLSNNTSSKTATVLIRDTISPVVITKNITIFLNASGQATLNPASINNGSSDNCGINSMSLDKSDFSCNDIGNKTVTLTVSDSSNNTSSKTAAVLIRDTISPVAITKNITLFLNASGQATLNPASINNGSSDNCGINSMSLDKSDFSCNDIGNKTVTLTVSDLTNNKSSKTATVLIRDTISPIVITKNINKTLSGGIITLVASDINNGSYDNCGIASMSASPSTFTCSKIGSNLVTLTITDVNGNIKTANATVVIAGTIPSVSISQSKQSSFCNGTVAILKSTSSETVTYLWSNSATTPNLSVISSGTYSLTVTNSNGCKDTKSINYTFDGTDLLSSYAILVSGESKLSNSSVIIAGGVGSLGSTGLVEANTNSSITASGTFAEAKTVSSITGGTIATAYSNSPVDFSLPIFVSNPYCANYGSNVTVKSNATITLKDSIYKNIVVGSGAKVTFSAKTIYANTITTGTKVTFIFSQCPKIVVCENMLIDESNTINALNKSIIFYCAKDVRINKGTVLNGAIYSNGKIESFGASTTRVKITGKFLAANQYHSFTDISSASVCSSCTNLFGLGKFSGIKQNTPNEVIDEISLFPNPTNNTSTLRLNTNDSGALRIKIFNITGSLLYTYEISDFDKKAEIPLNMNGFATGIYIVKAEYADKVKALKLYKLD